MINKFGSAALSRLSDFLFPPLCIICDQLRNSNQSWFCDSCLTSLKSQIKERNACPRCSIPVAINKCTCSIAWDFPFSKVISFLDFNDLTKVIMHHIKYKGKKDLAFHMGQLAAQNSPVDDLFSSIDLIIPVPLHRSRLLKRGYNQAEWLAKGVAEACCSKAKISSTILIRTRATGTQTKLNKTERAQNLKDVFAINISGEKELQGKSVVVVDDVVTTGATVSSCASVLLEGGARSVQVLSLLRD